MKIVTIVGARPQFIKVAAVSRPLRTVFDEIIIHTGQHYDANMSDIFFKELNIPKPDYNLNANGKSHGEMTGKMLMGVERLLQKEKPDIVLVYGDTNSTLAGALAAVKLNIPICHVEAGNRLRALSNPEEVNRVLTDRISSLLLCSVESSVQNLKKENLKKGVFFVGDPMYDAYLYYSSKSKMPSKLNLLSQVITDVPDRYYYLTCHREENTNDMISLNGILSAMESLDYPVIFPVHPRIKDKVEAIIKKNKYNNILATNPVGYLHSIAFIDGAEKIITDSGGVQREAFFAQKQCLTIFNHVIWPETMIGKRNQLSSPDKTEILNKLNDTQIICKDYEPFGDGNSGEHIKEKILEFIKSN